MWDQGIDKERGTLFAIYACADRDGYTWVTPRELAAMTGRHYHTLMHHVRRLKELGYIERGTMPPDAKDAGRRWIQVALCKGGPDERHDWALNKPIGVAECEVQA